MVVVAHESYFVPSVTLKGKVSLSQSTSTSCSGLSHALNVATSGVHCLHMIPKAEKRRKKYYITSASKLCVFCIIVFLFWISLSQIFTVFFFPENVGRRRTRSCMQREYQPCLQCWHCIIMAVANQKALATLATAQRYILFPYRFIFLNFLNTILISFCDKN